MDALSNLFDSQWVLLIGAIAVSLLLVRLLVRLLSVSWGTILTLAAIALLLQFGFGIGPRQLWFEVSHLPQMLARLVQGWS